MEPMLANGELAGKIVCPNKKCGAKIGNYDWAGVCCGCKEWVTPVRQDASVPSPPFSCMLTTAFAGLLYSPLKSGRDRRVNGRPREACKTIILCISL